MSRNIKITLIFGAIVAIILSLYGFLSPAQKYSLFSNIKVLFYLVLFVFVVSVLNYIFRSGGYRFAIYSSILLFFIIFFLGISPYFGFSIMGGGMGASMLWFFGPLILLGWLLSNLLASFVIKKLKNN